jgi:hypothetical protein
VQAIKTLARAHQSMIWSRAQRTNRLGSTLREPYPAALVVFDNVASDDALEVLRVAPTPGLGRGLQSISKISTTLRRAAASAGSMNAPPLARRYRPVWP